MKTDTAEKITDFIKAKGQARVHDIADYLGISTQAIHRQLRKLIDSLVLEKTGKPPKVFYRLAPKSEIKEATHTQIPNSGLIDDHFLFITPSGESLEGVQGFTHWCNRHKLPVVKTAQEYERTLNKYNDYKKGGLIDGMHKMADTFSEVYLDRLFYVDFYAIERFGKTKLGQRLLYAKQSQDKYQIELIIKSIKPHIDNLSDKYKIDGIGFIPPSIKREIQLMKEMRDKLNPGRQLVSITKVRTPIIVPQKTLNKLEDRVENANKTIIVDEKGRYRNILLIDDAVGSGATLNVTAEKLKKQGACSGKIIALAAAGSFKGFPVISEV